MRSGILLAVVLGGTSGVVADTLHVPGDFPTIQEAIVAAVDGDEVEVHPGTYFEAINFLGKAIRVYSSDGPDVTIIDAQQTGSVVTCDSGEGSDTVLDGFTITGGTGTDLSGTGVLSGGGMLNEGSSPTVTNCTFSGNTASRGGGGGMSNIGGSPTVTNCTFSGNSMTIQGGGMSNFASSAAVTNCTFSGNTAVNGGGMSNDSSSPTVTNCTFSGNTAFVAGGGMFNGGFSPTVTNCTFSGNSANFFGGGGMFNVNSSATVTNCTFSGNTTMRSGGGMLNVNPGSPMVTNCIFWGDSPDEISGAGMVTVSYSDVQGGFVGIGNIDAGNNWGVPVDELDFDEDGILCELFPVDLDGNPRFNADEADFDPGCGVPVVVDMGAYEYQFDPVDQVTFADLNGDGAIGVKDLLGLLGSWGLCGKGCCLADLDINGSVGVPDLLALLGSWGPCP